MGLRQLTMFMLCFLILATFNTAQETSLEAITVDLEPPQLIDAAQVSQQPDESRNYYPTRLKQVIENYEQRNFLISSFEAASLPVFEQLNDGHFLVYVIAGKKASLPLLGSDPDRDIGPAGRLIWTYVEPFNIQGQWDTDLNDVGVHDTLVSLSDGEYQDYLRVTVLVLRKNDPPKLTPIPDVTVTAGEFVTINIMAKDPDNDPLKASMEGFMDTNPYRTDAAEVGEHIVTVKVSDGFYRVSQKVHVFVVPREEVPKEYIDRTYIIDKDRDEMNFVDYIIDRERDTGKDMNFVDYVIDHPREEEQQVPQKETNLVDYTIWHERHSIPADAMVTNHQQTITVYQ